MFADRIGESCTTTGTGTFSTGGAYGAFQTWRSGFASGAQAFYLATNDTGAIWEIGYGIFTTGSPDTLTRTLLASSSGALINWQTTPYRLYSVPNAAALKHMLAPLVNGVANVPAWLPSGAAWIDYSLGWVTGLASTATAWVKNRFISGTLTAAASHAEEGRHYLNLTGAVPSIFAASQRCKFEDKGAANYPFTANDIGKVLAFDCTAAVRTLTMLAASAAGMGHGAYVDVLPYGHKVNGVTFTPSGGDTTDLATAPPGRITRFEWDGARSKWVTPYAGTTAVLRSYLAGLGMANNTGTPNTKLDVAAGQCADDTGVLMMSLAAATIDCGTTGANGLDTGALGASTWYHVFAIGKATDGTTAFLASTSLNSPTMPSGYTLKRRIGSFKTDGSAHILAFIQDGDYFNLAMAVLEINTTNPGTAAVTAALGYVPTGVNVEALLEAMIGVSSTSTSIYISDLAANDQAPQAIGSSMATPGLALSNGLGGTTAGQRVRVRTNTSAQFRYRMSASAADVSVAFVTLGWIDRRGRNA